MINVSDQDSFVWYIKVSHLNRYLFMDIIKALTIATVLVLGVQILPLGNAATTFITIIIGGIAFWGVALIVKMFTSFTGHTIRFLMDAEGVDAMSDEGKLGLSYVERQVSTLSDDILSSNEKLLWNSVTGYDVDDSQKIITLKKGEHGTLRLFCNEDNFDSVLGFVRDKTEAKQEIL